MRQERRLSFVLKGAVVKTVRLGGTGASPWSDRNEQPSAPADTSRGTGVRMTQTATLTSEPQRMRALERANEIRLARAELKRRIADGGISAAEVILAQPLEARSWAIGELLTSQRRWGYTRSRKFLSQNLISETKQLGALTERQRQMLASQLASCHSAGVELLQVHS